jgi:hypothetical protein
VLGAGSALAQETKSADVASDDTWGRQLLAQKLNALMGAERGQVIPLANDALGRTFTGHLFYGLRFRQYPVAAMPPDPVLRQNCVRITWRRSVLLGRGQHAKGLLGGRSEAGRSASSGQRPRCVKG